MDHTLLIIQKLLKERHKEKQELTTALGYKTSSVFSDWLSGKNSSYKKKLPEIADFFGITTDQLLGSYPAEELGEAEFALMKEARDLSPEDKQDVLNFIKFLKSKKE